MNKKINQRGIGLIEILIAAAIIGLVLTSLAAVGNFALKISDHLKKNIIAANLAAEAIEAAKSVKEENWNNIAGLDLGAAYHPSKTGSPLKWTLSQDSETINGFSRQVVLSPVYRDSNDDIAAAGGTLDSDTKKITAAVFWQEGSQNYQINLTAYLANWKP
jgi:type II secretory pathway pseudopilin PulG